MGTLGACILFLTGCIPDAAKRAELAAEHEKERDLAEVRIIREVADVGNVGPLKVDGIGLVTGLAGTGHSPDGYYRNLMEQYLLKNMGSRDGAMRHVPKDQSVKQILDDPDNCLVIVSGYIPAGARKADRFDVEISLPDGSKATSLAGGYLHLSMLRVYEAASNLSSNPLYKDSRQLLPGHVLAHAKGQLVVGFGGNTDVNELKKARVWQGGVSRINRPYSLVMRNDGKSVKIANDVAQRINFMYQEDPLSKARHADYTRQEAQILLTGSVANQVNQRQDSSGLDQRELAKATGKDLINVRVPFLYRLDHERYLHVSGFTPLNNGDPKLVGYRERLKKMLLDPRDTIRAARRLEALGRDTIPDLKTGLAETIVDAKTGHQVKNHPFVQFASAEALAYLGSTAGVDVLCQLAREHPMLVKHCTTALASLGENVCRDRLAEMLASDEPALRCAAFHALAQIDEADKSLNGQFLNETVWMHHLPQSPGAMVYFSTSKRPQVILFGKNIVLSAETRLGVGKDYTVVADGRGDVLVKRITVLGEEKRICTNRLDGVLIGLTELGASYPDIVDFLNKARDGQLVPCPIVNWQTPEVTLETLVEYGKQMQASR
jgi:hypothetical protein